MSVDLTSGIVRILKPDGKTAGTGFVVSSKGLVITCAHVIQLAGANRGQTVRLVFHHTKAEAAATVDINQWSDSDKADVALLHINGEVPSASSLLLGSSEGTSGHPFKTFGFPEIEPEKGFFGYGAIGDSKPDVEDFDIIQLTGTTEVTQGFSGAPLLDTRNRRVIGMVSAITTQDRLKKFGETALITPTEVLRKICPDLQLSDVNPYRSLEAFTEEDSEFFFGRQRTVDRLLDRLRQAPRFLAVLGPSGSGKSSVIQAGLLPQLRQGSLPDSDHWGVIITRPTNLSQPTIYEAESGASNLERKSQAWFAEHKDKKRLVWIVDQFEELFITCPPSVRQDVVMQLVQLLKSDAPITVILGMRDDFYRHFSDQAKDLLEWLERGLVNIVPVLEADELEMIVRRPLDAIGLELETGLADVIVNDAIKAAPTTEGGGRNAQSTILPLLEFALARLWEQREDGSLTHHAYLLAGGVTGGLTQWANQTYDTFDDNQKRLARRILVDLVHLGDESQGFSSSRQRQTMAALCRNKSEYEAVLAVVVRLADARLLVTTRDDQTGEMVVEIIHEVLLREWSLLQQWLLEDRKFRAWQERLHEAIRDWETSETDNSALLRGVALVEAKDWIAARESDLTDVEKKFIRKSANPNVYSRLQRIMYWLYLIVGVLIALIGLPVGIMSVSGTQGWLVGIQYSGFGILLTVSLAVSLWWTSDRRYRVYQAWQKRGNPRLTDGADPSWLRRQIRKIGIDISDTTLRRSKKWIVLTAVCGGTITAACVGLMVWFLAANPQESLDRALIEAVNTSNLPRVRELLDKGANPRAMQFMPQAGYFSPVQVLPLAVQKGSGEIVKLLLNRGADGREAALVTAANLGRNDMIDDLLASGADVNAHHSDLHGGLPSGRTPLTLAATNGHIESMKLLLKHGADINQRGLQYGETALAGAASSGQMQAVQLLLSHGADFNMRDKEGKTALMWARESERSEIVSLLIKAGAQE